MDYFGKKCPVCDKYFHIGDDVVVCPDCGTPAHRECYNEIGRCVNYDKHGDGYDFKEETNKTAEKDGFVICKKCGTENPDYAFYCENCNEPLLETPPASNAPYGAPQQGYPNMGPNVIFFDPLAGVKPEEELSDNVTAGECAKLVKQNTPYFIRIFNNIKKFSKSKYNFCAFLFGGGYLLYRKMYKIGAILTALQLAITVGILYLNYYILSASIYTPILEASQATNYGSMLDLIYKLDTYHMTLFITYFALSFLNLVFKIIIGGVANRMYYKHCVKTIKKVKAEATLTQFDKEIEKRSGVNTPLAMSLLISYMIISIIPNFFI